ncbi:MAG: GGDEF domain-containing protein [Spirochaetes bacterium]|nr:GGDEF domain-containing protein [Spirochaetota bacterium]
MKKERTPENSRKTEPDAFEMDAINLMVHLLSKDMDPETLTETIEYLNKLSLHYTQAVEKIENLQDTVNYDPRTGLFRYNELYFENIFKNISRIFSSYQTPNGSDRYQLSYIRFDIDDFSLFNNRYGHEIGDQVLRKVGEALKETARPTDYTIRYGGEELDVILTTTPIPGAITFLEKIYKRFHELRIDTGKELVKVTLSAGVSHIALPYQDIIHMNKDATESLNHLVQREADHALYEAKLLGKDRWCLYDKARAGEYDRIRADYVARRNR